MSLPIKLVYLQVNALQASIVNSLLGELIVHFARFITKVMAPANIDYHIFSQKKSKKFPCDNASHSSFTWINILYYSLSLSKQFPANTIRSLVQERIYNFQQMKIIETLIPNTQHSSQMSNQNL